MIKIPNEIIFTVLRTLKKLNPGDTYLENYQWHLNKRRDSFFDIYHFAWSIAIENHPKSILEIGTRTGISLAQLLCGYLDTSKIERIVSCDLFNDGFCTPKLVTMNLKHLGIPQTTINKITFLTGDSKVTLPKYIEENPDVKFDYILVDGEHSPDGAKRDLDNAFPLLASGGVLAFDDISPDGMNLLDVWQNFKAKYADPKQYEWFEDLNGKGLGWVRKKKDIK